MANKKTEYTLQYLKNLSADHATSPPIPREAWLAKDPSGNWRVIRLSNTGALLVNV